MNLLSSVPILLGMPGPLELGLILLIVLLIFGASRLPKIFRSFGSGITEFKKGIKEGEKEEDKPEDKPEEKKD